MQDFSVFIACRSGNLNFSDLSILLFNHRKFCWNLLEYIYIFTSLVQKIENSVMSIIFCPLLVEMGSVCICRCFLAEEILDGK